MLMNSPKTSWFQQGFQPDVAEEAYVAATATVIGPVTIAKDVMVSPGASIRGDEGGNIFIGQESNVQDHVIMHGLLHQAVQVGTEKYSIYVAERVSCAHASLIHGPAFIGNDTFIGFGALVISSHIGRNCYIGHGSRVIGVTIPDGKFVPHGAVIDCQEQADLLGAVPKELAHFNEKVVKVNVELARGYLRMQQDSR